MRVKLLMLWSFLCVTSCGVPCKTNNLSLDAIEIYYRKNRNTDFKNCSLELSVDDEKRMRDWVNSLMSNYELLKSYTTYAPGVLIIRNNSFNINASQTIIILNVSTDTCKGQFVRSVTEEDKKLIDYFSPK